MCLRRSCYEFPVNVNDGLEEIDALRTHTYDIVFLDVQMPRMNGIETANYFDGADTTMKKIDQLFPTVVSYLEAYLAECSA